ncbi:MAG: iron-containing alcohol dehydrogenase, partial [Bryobacteraceae bacterium]
YGTPHGVAIALLLPSVVRWNAPAAGARYAELSAGLAERLERLRDRAGLPGGLDQIGVPEADLPALAADAATQWTGKFNPRPFDAAGALEVYQCAHSSCFSHRSQV